MTLPPSYSTSRRVVGDLRLIEDADPDAFVFVGHLTLALPATMVTGFAIGRIVRMVTCLSCGGVPGCRAGCCDDPI